LGKGSFGEVWSAENASGFRAALKFVQLSDGSAEVEAKALDIIKRLGHPNLVHTFDAQKIADFLVIFMELADGTLLDAINPGSNQESPAVSRDQLLSYFEDAARAIDYLSEVRHCIGAREPVAVQHCDIKPANLLVIGGSAKVADFSLAQLRQHTITVGKAQGTLAFAAPEFFNRQISRSSDQYSLAVSYCQLRGGRRPFTGYEPQLIHAHLFDPPDLTMLPEEERAVVGKALAKNPTDRWPSCVEFVRQVRESASSSPRQAGRTVGKPRPASTAQRKPASTPVHRVPPGAPTAIATAAPVSSSIKSGAPAMVSRTCGSEAAASVSTVVPVPARPIRLIDSITAAREEQTGWAQVVETNPGWINDIGIEFRLIPPGRFRMGAASDDAAAHANEHPRRTAVISQPLWVATFPLTNAIVRQFLETALPDENAEIARLLKDRSFASDCRRGVADDLVPAVDLSVYDAEAICAWMGRGDGRHYRLPTEAEWEYFARSGSSEPYWWGKSSDQATEHAVFAATAPASPDNKRANTWHIIDVLGNVAEWTSSVYGPLDRSSPLEASKASNSDRVIRGGSWRDRRPEDLRLSRRSALFAGARVNHLGARVVCDWQSPGRVDVEAQAPIL
jgi:formylglycine-generating enzyme required for sulfatase activity